MDKRDVFLTRAMGGAQGYTDHRMVRSKLGLRLRPKSRLCAPNKRLNVAKLRDTNTRTSLVSSLESCPEIDFNEAEITDALLTSEWGRISTAMMECAERVLGGKTRKHRDWFDDQREEIKQLLDERNRRNEVYLRHASPENHALLRETRSEFQRELRRMKEN